MPCIMANCILIVTSCRLPVRNFSLSMDNKVKAVQAILAKKPYGLRFKPQELSFLVTYKDMDRENLSELYP